MRLARRQKGDTIIEVLFSITILTVVLASCYVIANKSITTNRLNYERTQGLKHAESQTEVLKSVSEDPAMTTALFLDYKNKAEWKNGDHCLTSDNQIKLSTDTACKPLGLYTLSLTYVPGAGEENGYFISRTTWDSDDPANAKVVETLYRVYNSVLYPGGVTPAVPAPVAVAANNDSCSSSGSKAKVGNFLVHTYTLNTLDKTFVTTCNLTVQYLIIGGGGAGGAGNVNEGGGGGGAGGMVEGSIAVSTAGTYAITIGDGGPSVSNTRSAPSNGQASSVFGVTAFGGGGGGSCWFQALNVGGVGANGGSGGGGSGCQTSGAGGSATQVPGFGTAGGDGQWTGGGGGLNCNGNGGGGGGAGSKGLSGGVRDVGACGGPAGGTWNFCANENGTCSFSGTLQVRYGKNSTWTASRTFTNGVSCNNATFGDPLVGTVKECQILTGATAGGGSIGGGGAGRVNAITGLTYAVGGNGGAGRGTAAGAAGTANTGSGGSGSSGNLDSGAGTRYPSGKGGSGIVLIWYPYLK